MRRRSSSRAGAAAMGVLLLGLSHTDTRAQPIDPQNPLAFFSPDVRLTVAELASLQAGDIVVKVIPSRGPNVAVFAAGRVGVTGAHLASRVSDIEEFRRSRMTVAIRRFSTPPRIEDLADLTLDEGQLQDLRSCRAGSCRLKLSAEEIERLQRVMARAGTDWQPAVQAGFREIVLTRVRSYLEAGQRGLPEYVDQSSPLDLHETFAEMLPLNRFLELSAPDLARHLVEHPPGSLPGVQSFLYWSTERMAARPVVSVTHVNILRGNPWQGEPEVMIASKQVFALHYMNASLGFTALIRPDPAGPHAYMAYVNRSSVDGLTGLFGGIRRSFVERRLRGDTAELFRGMIDRLEAPASPR